MHKSILNNTFSTFNFLIKCHLEKKNIMDVFTASLDHHHLGLDRIALRKTLMRKLMLKMDLPMMIVGIQMHPVHMNLFIQIREAIPQEK